MKTASTITLPEEFDWKSWVIRWERMQERYLVKRNERFEVIARLIQDTQPSLTGIIDLGCGTGSLMLHLLKMLPDVHVLGIDMDPTLLPLARKRTVQFGERAHLIQTDLRTQTWTETLPEPANAVVSATALHWLAPEQLKQLYTRLALILKPGGIFLNADHLTSDNPLIQHSWQCQREKMREAERDPSADDWTGFLNAYLEALGKNARTIREQALGLWEGSDEGLPLVWHLDQLREAGFSSVDCFWRCDCDGIYGGLRVT